MNTKPHFFRRLLVSATMLILLSTIPRAIAVDALLLQDTYVDTGRANNNYGTSGDLRVLKSGSQSIRAFLKFSIATLPGGATAADIKQARLRLWVNSSSQTLGSITLTPVTAAWNELTLTNNTSGTITFGLPKHADLPISSIGNFVSIDITDWVQGWIAGTLANQGFVIETSAISPSLNLYFDSKESSLTSHEPQLDITLVGPAGPQGSPGPQGPQGIQGLTGATGPVGPAGATGPQGTAGVQGPQGLAGQPGATGPQGQSADLAGTDYNWTTDTTDSWPDNGNIRLNAPTGEGFIYLSDADVHGADQEIFVETMLQSTNPVKGYFVAVRPDNPRWMKMFAVTSGVEAGGYYRLAVLRIVEVGGTWPNNTPVKLTFIRNGDKGDKGDTGTTGPAGPIGQTGAPGPQGSVGPAGVPGATGTTGPQGPEGIAGPIGPAGAPGAAGPRGAAVLSGNELPPSDALTGQDGDFYINTQLGNIYGPKSSGIWGYPIGTLYGRNGAEWHLGPSVPNPDLGVYGDFYLQTTTGDVFKRWGEDGAWYNVANIRGPQGNDGVVGPKGDPGTAGAIGAQGPAGSVGATGASGPAGPDGPAGPPGPQGIQGPAGPVLTRVEPQGDLSMGEFTQGPTP